MSLHIFDIDHTLLSCNGSYEFGRFLYKKGFISLSDSLYCIFRYAHHKLLGSSFHTLHSKIFNRIFLQKKRHHIEKLADLFFDEHLDSLLNPKTLKCFEDAKKRKEIIAFASTSPDFLIRSLAKKMHITNFIATCYATDDNGFFSAITHIVDGNMKAEYAISLCEKLSIATEKTTAYSDNVYDLPLFEIVGNPIAVTPGKALFKICQERKWEIVE